jgi:TatA/E family protein of Tat protein translocase
LGEEFATPLESGRSAGSSTPTSSGSREGVDMHLGVGELLLIFAVVLLLFGATRLPQLARSMGQARREFTDGKRSDSDQPAS